MQCRAAVKAAKEVPPRGLCDVIQESVGIVVVVFLCFSLFSQKNDHIKYSWKTTLK